MITALNRASIEGCFVGFWIVIEAIKSPYQCRSFRFDMVRKMVSLETTQLVTYK